MLKGPKGLRDVIYHDNLNVFMNPHDFGEIHSIQIGEQCYEAICIVQDINSNKDLTVTKDKDDYYPGLFGLHKQLNIAKKDVPEVPVEGQLVYLDDAEFIVESCSDDVGILTILLSANET